MVGKHSPPQGTVGQRCVVVLESTSKKEVIDAMRSAPHARSYIRIHEGVGRLPNSKLLRILITSLNVSAIHNKYSVSKMVNLQLLQVNPSSSSSSHVVSTDITCL